MPASAPFSDLPNDPRWQAALSRVVDDESALALHAQPIVELPSGRVAGYELLARFTDEVVATPDRWFAAAEHWGCNAALQRRVIQRALATRDLLPPGTFLTVNVEPHLLAVDEVVDALLATADLTRVVLELTEHTAADDERRLLAVLDAVRSRGGLVAMDDAGTGYAGLSMLLAMRPQVVKLDREIISGLDTDPVKSALVEVMGDLASRMDAWVLAEGVETVGELDALVRLGVPLTQGYLLGRPMPQMVADIDAGLVERVRTGGARSALTENVVSLVSAAVVGHDQDRHDVLLDAHGLPAQVRHARDAWAPAMVVSPAASPAEAARRAMARPPEHRYAPLVCTDSRGGVIGVVQVDALVSALARSRD